MNNNPVFVKPNIVIEPLIKKWYAWSHLISPATAARNITERHLKIMDSYIQAPHIHEAAVKNPQLLGGPFMDFDFRKIEEVKQLREETVTEQSKQIELSEAIGKLDNILKKEASGFSLEALYERVPEILKGYVELVYDLNNNASYRFFESLVYKSEFHDPSHQSITLWETNNDERPFVLSTPRIEDRNAISLNIPFSHKFIDKLSRAKKIPQSIDAIFDGTEFNDLDRDLISKLFTDTRPKPYDVYKGDKIRMRYFGHACILIETKNTNVLIDPLISYYGYQSDVSRFSDADIPDFIDYVLITHNHQDHILFETLLQLRHKIGKILVPRTTGGALQDPNLKLMFNSIGFNNIIELEEMESVKFDDCEIMGIPFIGEHCDLNIQSKICYHLKVDEFSILFAADSCNVEPVLYQHVQKEIGNIDVLFLGMECEGAPLTWLYGPLLTKAIERDKDDSRRLAGSNFLRAKAMVETFNPLEVYVYAMGQEPWVEFISSVKYTIESKPIVQSNYLIEYCKSINILAERLYGEKEILYNRKNKRTTKLSLMK